MKLYLQAILLVFLVLLGSTTFAQDAVIIEDGNFVRGTVQGTDFATVRILLDDKTVADYKAKDIKEFLWNGDAYISKPVVLKKKMEFRFFKVEELGAVNLYSMGNTSVEETPEKRVKVRPSIGVGLGSGGYGGFGLGGGITFGGGGGRRDGSKQSGKNGRAVYYIEKPGTGPLQEIPLDGTSAGKTEQVKTILLQKLTNDEDLAERIKATESFDAKSVQAFVSAYNAMHK
jgi:hypothetical protein